MKIKSDGKTCPHCGSASGIIRTLRVVFTQWLEWDGTPINAQGESRSGYETKSGKCVDCHRRVLIPTKEPNDER